MWSCWWHNTQVCHFIWGFRKVVWPLTIRYKSVHSDMAHLPKLPLKILFSLWSIGQGWISGVTAILFYSTNYAWTPGRWNSFWCKPNRHDPRTCGNGGMHMLAVTMELYNGKEGLPISNIHNLWKRREQLYQTRGCGMGSWVWSLLRNSDVESRNMLVQQRATTAAGHPSHRLGLPSRAARSMLPCVVLATGAIPLAVLWRSPR